MRALDTKPEKSADGQPFLIRMDLQSLQKAHSFTLMVARREAGATAGRFRISYGQVVVEVTSTAAERRHSGLFPSDGQTGSWPGERSGV
jgi:hypothetical protein